MDLAQDERITVDIVEACRLTGLSRSTLLKIVYAGEIASVKIGRRRLVLIDSLRSYFRDLASDDVERPPSPPESKRSRDR